jgi:mannose-6-phosphate isomerase-like protein (cupin superfamily)
MENTTLATAPFLITRDAAPSYWLVDSLWSVLATADTTGGALTVIDQIMPRRSGPPPHIHERLHEYFYLLDGEIRFQLGTEVTTATTGSMLSIPPKPCTHSPSPPRPRGYSTCTRPAASASKSATPARPPPNSGCPAKASNYPLPPASRTPTSPDQQN